MTKEELTEIVKLADVKAFEAKLKTLGYKYCNTSKKLGKVGIVELVQSVTVETVDFTDNEHKHLYNGRICGTVKGYENYVYDIKPSKDPFDDKETAMQTSMLIWAKEL